MAGQYGWGVGSTIALLIVAAIIFFVPLGMSSLKPPPAFLMILFPVFLGVLLYFLHQASKPK